LSLCLINLAPRHEDVWGSGGIAQLFFSWAVDKGEWSAPRPSRFTSGEGAPDTHLIGGWVGPQILSERSGIKKNLFLLPEIEPQSSSL
jgi:hypothetical protein